MGRRSPDASAVSNRRPQATVLRHVTSDSGRPQSVEEVDPALSAAAKGRMAALMGVISVAYALSYAVEQVMRTGLGTPTFTDIKLLQNVAGAIVTGLAFCRLRSPKCSLRAASILSYVLS